MHSLPTLPLGQQVRTDWENLNYHLQSEYNLSQFCSRYNWDMAEAAGKETARNKFLIGGKSESRKGGWSRF